MSDRFVHVIWCDDIRQEVGNKPSFMGVYTDGVVVPQLPTVLPRLSVWITVSASLQNPIQQFALRVERDDKSVLMQADDITLPVDSNELRSRGRTRQAALLGFTMAPLELPAGCKYLQVCVDTQDGDFFSAKLWIDVNPAYLANVVPSLVPQPQQHAPAATPEGSPDAAAKPARKRAATKRKSSAIP